MRQCDDARLADFCAGQTYEVRVNDFRDGSQPLDITGRIYILTLKRDLALTDAQAIGAAGAQVRVVATADDSAASLVVLRLVPAVTEPLSGDYFADVTEITPGTPNIVTPVVPVQKVTVTLPATRSIA